MEKNNIYSSIWNTIDTDSATDLWVVIWNNVSVFPKNCIMFNFDCMSITSVYNQFVAQLDNSPDTQIKAFIDFSGSTNPAIMTALIAANSSKFPGQNYQVVPLGCSNYNNFLWNSFVPNPLPAKDIDVLYYGSSADRRQDIINAVSNFCLTEGKVFYHLTPEILNEQSKVEYITRSNIVLSIVGQDNIDYQINDLEKVSYLICNKALFIAEFTGDAVETTISAYTNYCSTTGEMIDRIKYYLFNATPEEISTYVDTSYNNFHTDFPYNTNISDIILPFTV